MGESGRWLRVALLSGLLWALFTTSSALGVESPYEFDPTLSLTGDCFTNAFDPVPDPSCSGQPPSYPPPPGGPAARFDQPRAITVDAFGNVYVANWDGSDKDGRIDIFDDEGKFLVEIAAPNAQSIAVDSKGTLYVFEDEVTFSDPKSEVVRYEPSTYHPETGKIEYANPPEIIDSGFTIGAVAVDTSPGRKDQLVVVRATEITRYKSAAEGNEVINGPSPLPSNWPYGLAIDGQRGRLFISFCKDPSPECGVKVLEATAPYAEIAEIDSSATPPGKFVADAGRLGIAVDEETGSVFVVDVGAKRIYKFDEDYEYLSEFKLNELETSTSVQPAVSNGTRSLVAEPCGYPDPETLEVLPGDACNRHYLFVPLLKSKETGGRAVAFHPPGETAPVIEGVSPVEIGEIEAELQAEIDPRGLDTTYRFEITTQAAWEVEAEKFEDATIIPGASISASSLPVAVRTLVTDLVPGETYRFRVVAENSLGKAPEEGQNEMVFATYDDAPIALTGCSNRALRLGRSALLPDCRAYELVTPAETNGRPPKGSGFTGNMFTTVHASPAGDAVSFKIEGGSIPGTSGVASLDGDPYVSSRTNSGWTTKLAGPSGDEATGSIPQSTSPDQGYSFWMAFGEGPLVIDPKETQYVHYPDGHSELIGRGSLGTDPKAFGKLITDNASHIIFETINEGASVAIQLEPDAPPTGTKAVYDRTIDPITGVEETHTVSLLPNDVTPAPGQSATYLGASKDGEGIAFSIGNALYLRLGNETTFEIGTGVEFAGVSEGGERIFYIEGKNLKAFDTSSEEVVSFSSTGNVVTVNVASDGRRAYFVSPSVLGGTNPEGEEAQAKEQNLYLSEEGAVSFIATVTSRDMEGVSGGILEGLGLWTKAGRQIARDPSRTNPDGSVLLFESRADITGYPESEFPQIYRYDAIAGTLQCISCIPTEVPATGGAKLESYSDDLQLPQPFSPYGFVPNLNPAGTRVFFDSTEALVSTDTDGVTDVYEWEANGVGSCTRPEGCIYLISSGQSERDNYLYGHSTSGDDVFFTTGDTLTGFDRGGVVSIYDAKVGGGFPEPVAEEPCIADGCRPKVSSPPAPPAVQSSAQGRGGNIKPPKPKTCPKGKRKVKKNGKVRCVKKQNKKGGKAKRANANRGAGK